jgi:hypothetical protein
MKYCLDQEYRGPAFDSTNIALTSLLSRAQ